MAPDGAAGTGGRLVAEGGFRHCAASIRGSWAGRAPRGDAGLLFWKRPAAAGPGGSARTAAQRRGAGATGGTRRRWPVTAGPAATRGAVRQLRGGRPRRQRPGPVAQAAPVHRQYRMPPGGTGAPATRRVTRYGGNGGVGWGRRLKALLGTGGAYGMRWRRGGRHGRGGGDGGAGRRN